MAKVIIVGGGVAGLSAGIFALEKGHTVTLFEKHFLAGGNLTGWQRKGFSIDNCIHWLTGTSPLTERYNRWQRVGVISGRESVYSPSSFYTVYDGENSLTMSRDIEKTKRDMLRLSKKDSYEIESFIKATKLASLYIGTTLNEKGKRANIIDKIKFIPYFFKYHRLSLEDLAKKFKHPTLKKVCVGFLGKELTALGLIIAYSDFTSGNGDLIKNGSYNASKKMVEKFAKMGGVLLTNKECVLASRYKDKIESVTFSDGSTYSADYYIFATDAKTAYEKILKTPMQPTLKYRYDKWKTFSGVSVAFAIEGDAPFEIEAIIPTSESEREKIGSDFFAVREFSYFENFAPKGKNVLVSLQQCDEDESARWINLAKNKEEYKIKKQRIANSQLREIERVFPSLKGKIEIIDAWTPYTYYKFTGESHGAFMSFLVEKNKAPFKSSNKIKGVKNACLASQWLQPPGGLPIALDSGYNAVKTMQKSIEKKGVQVLQNQSN